MSTGDDIFGAPVLLSPTRVLAVVAIGEDWRHALVTPYAFARTLGIVAELLVSLSKIAVDRGTHGVSRWIIAVVDDGATAATAAAMAALISRRA